VMPLRQIVLAGRRKNGTHAKTQRRKESKMRD
jgi:hypothetical protein